MLMGNAFRKRGAHPPPAEPALNFRMNARTRPCWARHLTSIRAVRVPQLVSMPMTTVTPATIAASISRHTTTTTATMNFDRPVLGSGTTG